MHMLQRDGVISGRVVLTCSCCCWGCRPTFPAAAKALVRTKARVSNSTAATLPRHLLCPALQQDVPGHGLHLLLNRHVSCLPTCCQLALLAFPPLLPCSAARRSRTWASPCTAARTRPTSGSASRVRGWGVGAARGGEGQLGGSPSPARATCHHALSMPPTHAQHPPSPASDPSPQARRAGTCLRQSWRSATP